MIIFLDFDGVLHEIECAHWAEFQHVPKLEQVLNDYPDVKIVISSTWRYRETLTELQMHFSEDMRHKIIDVTPQLADSDVPLARFKEISAWIAKNDYQGEWLAIDDQHGEFPKINDGFSQYLHLNLIAPHKRFGISDDDMRILRTRLSSLCP